jgi:hypothetical protein
MQLKTPQGESGEVEDAGLHLLVSHKQRKKGDISMRLPPLARAFALLFPSLAFLLSAGPASAATFISTVVVTDLNNPRDLAFGEDGALYIAEAGYRDTTVPPGSPNTFMTNGSITRFDGTSQTRVVTGLPSLYNSEINQVSGPNGLVFNGSGIGFVAIGFGGDPNGIPDDSRHGKVLTFSADGTVTRFANVAGFELSNNPAGGLLDSNPFHLAFGTGGLFASDAGSNAIYSLSGGGGVSLVATFPDRFLGPPVPLSNPVPTGLAVAPDGTLYVAELTGFPFTPGAAQIYSIAPGSSTHNVFATGFTNLTDLAFGPDGGLYALSLDTDSLLGPNTSGAIYRLGSDGSSQQIFAGLVNPTGMTFGSDGAIYVTNFGNTLDQGLGQVVRISAAVPEPATWFMMLLGFAALGQVTRRSRRIARAAC